MKRNQISCCWLPCVCEKEIEKIADSLSMCLYEMIKKSKKIFFNKKLRHVATSICYHYDHSNPVSSTDVEKKMKLTLEEMMLSYKHFGFRVLDKK